MQSKPMSPKTPNQSSDRGVLSFLKYIFLITKGSITLVFLLLLFGLWQTGSRFVSQVGTIFHAEPAKPEIEPPTQIVSKLRGASELTTAVFAMEAVVPARQDRKLGKIVVGSTTLLYIAYGEVRAGVDLSELETEDIAVTDERIEVILPPPQILDSKIDVNRSRVYDYNRGFLGLGPDVAPELQTLAQQTTLQRIVTTACSDGVLKEANDRAQLTVTQLLSTTGYKQVEVKTSPPSVQTCQLPPSTPVNEQFNSVHN
ncbi:MAG: DUF4230 domain-containing protein [Kamptonema sp. SIO1D9]|nr:DUF4230 domain-containing protein [Kamptonema sp. SIO1D9]